MTFHLSDTYLKTTSDIAELTARPWILLLGTLFSIAAGLFTWSLETRDKFLRREVEKRTAELQLINQELVNKGKEIESFIHIVSHDLKAPLVSIQGFANILKTELASALQGQSLDYFNRIINNAKQMSELLQDLLEFSRVGRIEDEKEEVDMGSLFREILMELKPEIDRKKIETVKADSFPNIWGSRKRIYQVFSNLIGNCVKYCSKVSPKIELSVQENGNYYEFAVKDNGIGIPKEVHGKVFQIFERFHPKVSVEGTGVGLSIVKKIVEVNRGHVRFVSGEGEGTTFFVSWPKARA